MDDFIDKMTSIITVLFNDWLPSLFNYLISQPLLCFILALMLFYNVVAFMRHVRNKTTL